MAKRSYGRSNVYQRADGQGCGAPEPFDFTLRSSGRLS